MDRSDRRDVPRRLRSPRSGSAPAPMSCTNCPGCRTRSTRDLYRVKDVLDSLFGPSGAAAGAILHKRRKDGAQLTHQARTV